MANKVHLQKHLPEFMRDFREMDALLSTENPEFDLFIEKMQTALSDCFIDTAQESAVIRYEKIMGLRSAPGDTLATRRLRISLTNGRVQRFSIAQFVQSAARLGEVVSVEMIGENTLLLEFISADPENIGLLSSELRLCIPAAMEIKLHNAFELRGGSCTGGTLCLSQCYTFGGVNR